MMNPRGPSEPNTLTATRFTNEQNTIAQEALTPSWPDSTLQFRQSDQNITLTLAEDAEAALNFNTHTTSPVTLSPGQSITLPLIDRNWDFEDIIRRFYSQFTDKGLTWSITDVVIGPPVNLAAEGGILVVPTEGKRPDINIVTAKLTWEPPFVLDGAGLPTPEQASVTRYALTWAEDGDDIEWDLYTVLSKTSYTVRGLKPDTEYTFAVKADVHGGEAKVAEVVITTPELPDNA